MNKSKCPRCGVKLGNFRYADACPNCREELKHNTQPLLPGPKPGPQPPKPWLVRWLTGVLQYGGS